MNRVEYDAYRADMESLQLGPKDATTQAKLHESQLKYDRQKQKFDKLRQDVAVKLKFLDENKVSSLLIMSKPKKNWPVWVDTVFLFIGFSTFEDFQLLHNLGRGTKPTRFMREPCEGNYSLNWSFNAAMD